MFNKEQKNFFNMYFLRKEKIYTKLKYSRVPIYDFVSGGAACLFASFLGFLVSERFGYELVDSLDLFYVYMYIIFTSLLVYIYYKNYLHNKNLFLHITLYINIYKNILLSILCIIKYHVYYCATINVIYIYSK